MMSYYYQIQNIHKAKCMYIHVHVYLRTCMDPGIFARVVGGPSPTGKKSPDNLFSPQLILQWGPNVYFKETIIFPKSKQGGGLKCQGVRPFPR